MFLVWRELKGIWENHACDTTESEQSLPPDDC